MNKQCRKKAKPRWSKTIAATLLVHSGKELLQAMKLMP